MSTKTNNKGASNIHPNMAAAAAGSGVTDNPSAALPTPPTSRGIAPGITMVLAASQLLETEAAVKTFRESLNTALAELYTALGIFSGPDRARMGSTSAQRKQSAGLYAGLLRQHPDIATTVDPDAIDAGLAVDAALALVKGDFRQPLPVVESSRREAVYGACADAAVVRSAARTLARRDTVLAAKIAAIDVILRRGKQVSTTADNVAKAQAKATKTQQRAAKVVAKAEAKAAKAARVATRTAQAHADNHPLTGTGDVVIVPAGTTPKG